MGKSFWHCLGCHLFHYEIGHKTKFWFVCMKTTLCESFAEMVDDIPAEAVPKAVEIERRMLEDDLAHERTESRVETLSLLNFCRFVEGNDLLPAELPVTHTAFYRKTVMRLIESGILPFMAKEKFDRTFCSGFLNSLAFG